MLLIILFSFYTLVNGMERVYLSKFITPGRDVTNQTYVTRDMTSMLTCIENCKLRKSCKFVNYEVRTKVCTLNIFSSPNIYNVTLTLRRGFVCAVKSDWDMTEYSDCSHCSEKETCVRNPNDASFCTISDCGFPPSVSGSIQIGNVLTTGSKIGYNCTENGPHGFNSTNVATCLSNGTWSEPLVTCIEDDNYTRVMLEDGTTLAYRIVLDEIKQIIAVQRCASDGAKLMAPITPAKMNYIRTKLHNEYSGLEKHFWTDIRNDRTADLIWRSSTLELLPRNETFWAPHRLAYEGQQRCSRFNYEENFFLENTYCYNTVSYICEKI